PCATSIPEEAPSPARATARAACGSAISGVDREKMNGDTSNTEAAKKLKDVEIEQKVQQQTQLNNEVTSLNAEILRKNRLLSIRIVPIIRYAIDRGSWSFRTLRTHQTVYPQVKGSGVI